MKSHPMLFNTEMARAIIDGRKDVTRRVMKHQEYDTKQITVNPDRTYYIDTTGGSRRHVLTPKARYAPGDLIWVKETYQHTPCGTIYKADLDLDDQKTVAWRSSMFMPRRFSRIDLRVVDVRGERLHDIDNADGLREGTPVLLPLQNGFDMRDCYSLLWDSIYAKRGYAWASNPMVWRIEFKVEEVRK